MYRRIYSGENLCGACFIASIERKVHRTISRYNMFRRDEHIAVAISGGKDSLSLLHVLKAIEEEYPHSRLSAILIDEGIQGYRGEAIEIAGECCEKLETPLHIHSFKRYYGRSLDEIAKAAIEGGSLSVCSYCGVLRRKALNLASREVGASKLALAHNLDDGVQSMVLSLLRGDLTSFAEVKPALEKVEGFVQRVKPFCQILEREVAFYAHLKGVRFQALSCPYIETSMRSDVRRFLNLLEDKHAGIKYGMYATLTRIQKKLKESRIKDVLNYCQLCEEPSSGRLCRACHCLRELGFTGETSENL